MQNMDNSLCFAPEKSAIIAGWLALAGEPTIHHRLPHPSRDACLMEQQMPFYTYIHTRNDDGSVFYVGKGHGGRAHAIGRNPHWNNIVNKHGHVVEIIEHFDDEQDAFAHERYLIASYRAFGVPLCNLTDGGEGLSNPSVETRAKMSDAGKGRTHSEEARAKISAANKGNKHLLGHTHSAEARARISKGRSGITPVYSHPEERIAKIVAANRGMKHSVESRAKISIASTGRTHSEESKRKMSIVSTGRLHSAETKARLSKLNTGKKLSPEHIEKIAAAKRGQKLSPEHRAKLSAAQKGHLCSPETRAKIGAANRKYDK